jgi:hypothetical protein
MKLIGIDSGKNGCIAELDLEETLCRFMILPYREDGMMDYTRIRMNFNLNTAHYIGIEKTNNMPIFGGRNWGFGYYYSAAYHLLESVPFDAFTPAQWQKPFHGKKVKTNDTKTAKDRTAAAFARMNPNFEDRIYSKEDAKAVKDAFFIAYYVGMKNNIVMPTNFGFCDVADDFF